MPDAAWKTGGAHPNALPRDTVRLTYRGHAVRRGPAFLLRASTLDDLRPRIHRPGTTPLLSWDAHMKTTSQPTRASTGFPLRARISRTSPGAAAVKPAAAASRPTFGITLVRLPPIDEAPGLIAVTVVSSSRSRTPAVIGLLTDAALRGRLSHFDWHSANEIAAIRRALGAPSGEITIYEGWPAMAGCVEFWTNFVGLQVHAMTWTCEQCGTAAHEQIGGSVGETFPRRCDCGKVARLTIPKYAPAPDPIPAR